MSNRHQPRAGSPIIDYKTRRVLGHWGHSTPAFEGNSISFHVMDDIRPSLSFKDASRILDKGFETYRLSIQRVFGSAEDEVQVWATDADPATLRRLVHVTTTPESGPAKDAEAIRLVLGMRSLGYMHPQDRDRMESYARYLEDRSRHQ